MANLRLWPSTNGPASAAVDNAHYTLAVEFYVTQAASFRAWYWWCNTPATDLIFTLWAMSSATLGTKVAETTGQGAGFALAAWNRVPFGATFELESNTRYRASVSSYTNNFYSSTSKYWDASSGLGGAAGITNGILVAPNAQQALGAAQGSFHQNSAGNVATLPTTGFNQTNYWVDVEVEPVVSEAAPQWSIYDGSAWAAAHPVVL